MGIFYKQKAQRPNDWPFISIAFDNFREIDDLTPSGLRYRFFHQDALCDSVDLIFCKIKLQFTLAIVYEAICGCLLYGS